MEKNYLQLILLSCTETKMVENSLYVAKSWTIKKKLSKQTNGKTIRHDDIYFHVPKTKIHGIINKSLRLRQDMCIPNPKRKKVLNLPD